LSSLPPSSQQKEIETSRKELEAYLGRTIRVFAYPYGGRADYNEESVKAVRNAGFSLACSNFPGMVWPKTDPFVLPRMLIRDCSGSEFEQIIDRIFG
jgi:peptidoglycan/xylan/chitin deacetylase (PgdA/CDA1 family)